MGPTRRPSASTRLPHSFRSARAFAWPTLAGLAGLALAAGCGRTGSLDDLYPGTGGAGPECGNGLCGASEDCVSCAPDCGPCAGCGDGACDQASETCGSCPVDCGFCPSCGNDACDADETCSSCPGDCDVCPSCGDGFCVAPEDCLSCAPDCGACPSCGDGLCAGTETCASCQHDCGVCSVCGNNSCEDFETCAICPQDCGQCEPIGCLEVVSCAFQCIDLDQDPPTFSIACVANCVSLGCADVQFFVDQVLTCAIGALPICGGDFGCIQQECDAEFAACLGATC